MWWSVPRSQTRFSTWKERSTVYHEGVPGHHLQIAQTLYRGDVLNRWRRIGSLVSGHAEGWALYAERLKAWQFLSAHSRMSEGILRYELDRYLGWPGQAPSYKIGERHWLRLRDHARAAEGSAFDLKSFHRRVLDIGSVGLDVLRGAVLDLDRSIGAP
jgi:uncharacterized protein (DUF885 family)